METSFTLPADDEKTTVAVYRFLTTLELAAPIDPVYLTLVEPERWWGRWRDLVQVERIASGDADGTGASFDAVVRAPLGYRVGARITTVATDRPRSLRMAASGGLEGDGVWRLSRDGNLTRVRLDWRVRTTAVWMNLLAPLARPLFERSHHAVVRHAAAAAAASLDAELRSVSSRAVR